MGTEQEKLSGEKIGESEFWNWGHFRVEAKAYFKLEISWKKLPGIYESMPSKDS